MSNIENLKSYRYKYKKYYGIDFSKEYDIHHINFDRNNNEIDNLILLPKKLHNKYHSLCNMLFGETIGAEKKIDVSLGLYNVSHTADILEKFAKTLKEMKEWIIYKNDLETMKRIKEKDKWCLELTKPKTIQ